MFKLDDNFLQELGLGTLPVEEKKAMLGHIYETLEMRVGMKLAEQMTNEQLDEFEGFIDKGDEAGALKWLETNFPNYKQVVADELEKLKGEIRTAAPQIVASSEQARMQAPAAAPQPAYPQQPAQAQYQPQPMPQPAPAAPAQQFPAPDQAYQPAPAAPVYVDAPTPQPYGPVQQQYGQPAYPASQPQFAPTAAPVTAVYPQPTPIEPQAQYQPQPMPQPAPAAPAQQFPAPDQAYQSVSAAPAYTDATQQPQFPQPMQFPPAPQPQFGGDPAAGPTQQ